MVVPPGQKNEKIFDLGRTGSKGRQNGNLARMRKNYTKGDE
jgi:hypothetical protein